MKMDINDFNSPLRGLLNSPARRFTPAVPIPDWNNLDSVIKSPQNVSASTEEQDQKKPDIQRLATPHTVIQPVSEHGVRSLQSPDIRRLVSEISSTPGSAFGGLINPHANIPVLNPVVSGPMQAKHSIKIQNCVSTVDSDCVLNLLNIYQKTRFSEYNPSRFHGLIMRLRSPKTTALLFGSGKMVCTGARNERDSYLAVYKFLRIVQKVGYPAVKMLDFKIQNFVATADIRFPVRLEMLHHSHGQFSSYEPELFPGLVYRMVRPRMVLLIFVNGKIVFTGAKSRSSIEDALDIIYPILRSFKKN